LDGNENSFGNWTRGHPYYTTTESLEVSYPCPETLWKAELKGNGLVYLMEQISRQQSIQIVAQVLLKFEPNLQ
jgi:hypothetical protein